MRWDQTCEAWTARLTADAPLESILGKAGRIYAAQAARPVTIPSVEYLLVSDREEEWLNPIGVQVDFWARGLRKAAQIERRIRLLTHSDVAQYLDGERIWMQFLDARTVEYPAEAGVVHRILDFMFTPVREKYVTA